MDRDSVDRKREGAAAPEAEPEDEEGVEADGEQSLEEGPPEEVEVHPLLVIGLLALIAIVVLVIHFVGQRLFG